jgi:exoribonuclease R
VHSADAQRYNLAKRLKFIYLNRIKTRQIDQLRDKRIVVVIDKWDAFSVYPSGHYVKEIGKVGDKATETDALVRVLTPLGDTMSGNFSRSCSNSGS